MNDNILYRMEKAGGRHYMQRINEPSTDVGLYHNPDYAIVES